MLCLPSRRRWCCLQSTDTCWLLHHCACAQVRACAETIGLYGAVNLLLRRVLMLSEAQHVSSAPAQSLHMPNNILRCVLAAVSSHTHTPPHHHHRAAAVWPSWLRQDTRCGGCSGGNGRTTHISQGMVKWCTHVCAHSRALQQSVLLFTCSRRANTFVSV